MSEARSGTGPDAPAAVAEVNAAGGGRIVLTCEHASNHVPAHYGRLGLPPEELERHIAWDIGAADLARALSLRLDAPLFLSGYSRLLIDCNRPLASPTSIVTRSEDTDIPGNAGLIAEERARRAALYFAPYHGRIIECLDRRAAAGVPTTLVGIHSFTPVFRGIVRHLQAGVLYREAPAFGRALIEALGRVTGLEIGDNEPYRVTLETDYTVPVHGDARGIPAALIEVRQDLLADPAGIKVWADRLADALTAVDGGDARPTALPSS